jgi:hypothetical protein
MTRCPKRARVGGQRHHLARSAAGSSHAAPCVSLARHPSREDHSCHTPIVSPSTAASAVERSDAITTALTSIGVLVAVRAAGSAALASAQPA